MSFYEDEYMSRRTYKSETVRQPPRVSEAAAAYLTSLRQSEASSELVRINLLVPAHVRKEWKAAALATDRTLTDLIIDAMQRMIGGDKPSRTSLR